MQAPRPSYHSAGLARSPQDCSPPNPLCVPTICRMSQMTAMVVFTQPCSVPRDSVLVRDMAPEARRQYLSSPHLEVLLTSVVCVLASYPNGWGKGGFVPAYPHVLNLVQFDGVQGLVPDLMVSRGSPRRGRLPPFQATVSQSLVEEELPMAHKS